VDQKEFKDGAVGVNTNPMPNADNFVTGSVTVNAQLNTPADQMSLFFTTDALRRKYPLAKFFLNMYYLPYARQDRVCNEGESHNLKVFCDMLNNLKYDIVYVADPHSSVASALINNLVVIDQYEIFRGIKPSFREWTIVAPDAGATKKCEEFAKKVGAGGVITFSKTREMSTGEITSLKPNQEISSKGKYLVLDDLVDGGRTFIELAKYFSKTKSKIELAVTHGIFSYGVEVVALEFDHVYTTNSFRNDLESSEDFTVIKF
jgi:ribose-phosphate pyrophosphokinase